MRYLEVLPGLVIYVDSDSDNEADYSTLSNTSTEHENKLIIHIDDVEISAVSQDQ